MIHPYLFTGETVMTLSHLSKRERDVAQLVLEGKSNKQIASSLGISIRTVEFHLKNIYEKSGVSSRVELVLKLGNTTAAPQVEKLGDSTVAANQTAAEDDAGLASKHWKVILKQALSQIGKELNMEEVMNPNTRDSGRPLTFFESIRICLAKYADFNGRASRSEFWWFVLFVTLVTSALAYFGEAPASVFLIAMLLPFLAAGARRLRDSGKSGWWQLFLLVPVGGLVILATLWAQPPADPMPEPAQPT
jgi:DNA-binding CsgD family transcriptional regulator